MRRRRDEERPRPTVETFVVAQLEESSDIVAIRKPLRQIGLARINRATVRFEELRAAARGHQEFQELLDLPPERVEHTERTAAGTWRYLKDNSAIPPSWAIRTFRRVGSSAPYEDRIPIPPPEVEKEPVVRVTRLIARTTEVPPRPPTRRDLEKKIESLEQAILRWYRRHPEWSEECIDFVTFEHFRGSQALEEDFTANSDPDRAPIVLVMYIEGTESPLHELGWGRSETRREFDRLVEATQFWEDQWDSVTWFFYPREEWLADAYRSFYAELEGTGAKQREGPHPLG